MPVLYNELCINIPANWDVLKPMEALLHPNARGLDYVTSITIGVESMSSLAEDVSTATWSLDPSFHPPSEPTSILERETSALFSNTLLRCILLKVPMNQLQVFR